MKWIYREREGRMMTINDILGNKSLVSKVLDVSTFPP